MSDNDTKPDGTTVDDAATPEAAAEAAPTETAATAEPTNADEGTSEAAIEAAPTDAPTEDEAAAEPADADEGTSEAAVEAAPADAPPEDEAAAVAETAESTEEEIEEPEPEPERRFTVEELERLLDFLQNKKRRQDTFYEDIEIVEIDWEKERILTRRPRPKPLPPSDEYMSFDFLVNFYAYHHGGIDKFFIDFR